MTEVRRPLTVLHLEDNSSDALLVRRQLGRDLPGTLVRWVSTEPDFKLALAREEIQVVVSDLSMPRYNGLSALTYAHAHYPLIPFIVFSSYDDPKSVRRRSEPAPPTISSRRSCPISPPRSRRRPSGGTATIGGICWTVERRSSSSAPSF